MYQDKDVIEGIYKRIPLDKILIRELGRGIKLGGKLAVKALLTSIHDKIKKSGKAEKGITNEGREVLKFLYKSKDDLSAKTIKKEQLQLYKEMLKEHGITFASISYDNEYAKIIFKSKQEEKVAAIVDKIEKAANDLDAKQEKEVYDIMNKLDFKEIREKVYRQQRVMTTEEIVSMKEELERKGIKSEIVINKVTDDNRYEVDFKIERKEREKVKTPLEQKINKAIEQSKEKAKELKERVREKLKGEMER